MRLLTKFVEGEYEKVDRLLDVRENLVGRIKVVDKEIDEEKRVCARCRVYCWDEA